MAGSPAGFSLIEIMVAVAILAVIVLIMSAVYHQSSLAWDAGMRKAKGNVTGRAVLGFIARELSGAVVETNLFSGAPEPGVNWQIVNGASRITFVSLGGWHSATQRIAREITYEVYGDGKLRRKEMALAVTEGMPEDEYGIAPAPHLVPAVALANKVAALKFFTNDRQNYGPGLPNQTNLPQWVRVHLELERGESVSAVAVWSYGPDGEDGTDKDDVTSW